MVERKILIKVQTEDDFYYLFKEVLKIKQPKNQNIKVLELDKDNKDNKHIVKHIVKHIEYKKEVKKKEGKKKWESHWEELTPFDNKTDFYYTEFNIIFSEQFDLKYLSDLFGQKITNKTSYLTYPKSTAMSPRRKRYISNGGNPKYPIYIISKGRHQNCITADHLIKMRVPFRIVIEKQEWDLYAKYYDEKYLLELDMRFKDEYDTYINDFDESKSKGSGPARNFVWHHAKQSGAKWHWLMDDNIKGFYIFNGAERIKIADGGIFSAAEDFINKYDNIGIAGLNYFMFAIPQYKDRPYVANTKIYSCLLINNDLPFRWAGRYNEDVDICLRALKEGYSTIQFDAFLADKSATQSMGGGNTDAFYAEEGTLPKSKMLANNHPDVTTVSWRFKRWHHIVDYSIFSHYENRSVIETLNDLTRKQLINKNEQNDQFIIDELKQLDLTSEIDYSNLLTNVDHIKRDKIINTVKFYRYKKDINFILDILTRKQILRVLDYIFLDENNKDEKIAKTIIETVEGTHITKHYDWESILHFVEEEKRNIIINELLRNKYIRNGNKTKKYKFKELVLTQEEHKNYDDSKAYLAKVYFNKDIGKIPVTFFDKVIRGEVTKDKKKFKKNLVNKGEFDNNFEDQEYKICITGNETLSDKNFFFNEVEKLLNEHQLKPDTIINFTLNNVDSYAADYTLKLGLKAKEYVPDFNLYAKTAIEKSIKEITKFCDCVILFIDKSLINNQYLIFDEECKKNNVNLYIVYYGKISKDIDKLF